MEPALELAPETNATAAGTNRSIIDEGFSFFFCKEPTPGKGRVSIFLIFFSYEVLVRVLVTVQFPLALAVTGTQHMRILIGLKSLEIVSTRSALK